MIKNKHIPKCNQRVISEKCGWNDSGPPVVSVITKNGAWRSHYNLLLNGIFAWDKGHLSTADLVLGPADQIDGETVIIKASSKMKNEEAAEERRVVTDVL